MKKLFPFLFAILFSVALFGQTLIVHKETISKPVLVTKTIDTSIQVILPKEEVKSLQLTADTASKKIQAQDSVITAKTAEVKTVKENSVPVGNGNGVYILIGIVVVLAGAFVVAKYKKTIGGFLSLNEKDLIKGTVITFIMAILTSLYNIINTGSFPMDWNQWKVIIVTSLSTGIAYLLKNLLSGANSKMPETKPEDKPI